MDQINTPLALLERIKKTYMHTFYYLDRQRSLPSVSDSVYLHLVETGMELSAAVASVPVVAACYTWRTRKRMYVFDDALARSLAAQAEDAFASGKLPEDLIPQLPMKAFYVQAPEVLCKGLDGFFLWREGEFRLRLVFLMADMFSSFSAAVCIAPEMSLADCLPDPDAWIYPHILNAARGNSVALDLVMGHIYCPGPCQYMIHNLILRALQLVQYLSCDNADITLPENLKAASSSSGTSQGDSGETYTVGKEIGKALREAAQHTPGVSPKAHTRKGHWHSYWVGPKTGERKKITKWVAPTLVGRIPKEVDVQVVSP